MWGVNKHGLNLYSSILFGRGRKAKERKKEMKTEFWLFSKEELNQKEIFNLKRKIRILIFGKTNTII